MKTFEVTADCKYEIGDGIAGINISDAVIIATHMTSPDVFAFVVFGSVYCKKHCVLKVMFSHLLIGLVAFDPRNVGTCMALDS